VVLSTAPGPRAVAAVSVVGPSTRFRRTGTAMIARHVQDAARQIAERLGR
jgi:DNA-binding IclR family transcriptional regulator